MTGILLRADGRRRTTALAVYAFFLFLVLSIQEVGYTAELLGRTLQGFDLLAQLSLFGLFLPEHFVDISHATAS